jgi:hypothetical protein
VCQSKKYIYTTPPKKKTHKKTTAIITFYSAVVLFEQSHFGFIPPQGVIRQVPLVEQELPTRPEHLGSPPVFSGVFVTQSLVFCVICFVDRCLSCWTCSFCHCVVCSSIYEFWSPLGYLQTLLNWLCTLLSLNVPDEGYSIPYTCDVHTKLDIYVLLHWLRFTNWHLISMTSYSPCLT